MTETERLRLVQSFLLSRLTHHQPYFRLTLTQIQSLDGLLRKVYRAALLLPPSASSSRLTSLGLHNTITELLDAHRTAQYVRLSLTPTGRHIFHHLRINPSTHPRPIPRPIRHLIRIRPSLRNMHPSHHHHRRLASAQYHATHYPASNQTHYVDAAAYPEGEAFALAVDGQ
ncbi:hypothetical protein HPB48_014346 [Haemaphysalis longicornis]|uniref:Uncharacterized protein n=1 Tax=Haemaphysalis longicornis TaxID=44386 RepID=A0A9J6G1Z8_HAELO|nr:hypothetical protein HPB48_014346 [Haemaphysalis longicornis]